MIGKTICVIGDMQIRPEMNLDHVEHIGRYIVDKKPNVIVQIGDWWDMPSLSSYDRGKASFEGRRVKEDIEAGHEGMRRLFEPIKKLQQAQRYFKKKLYSPRLVLTLGNHCERLDRAAQAKAQKESIKIIKEKKDLTWLTDRGIVPLRSQKQRRTQIVEHILKERNDEVA